MHGEFVTPRLGGGAEAIRIVNIVASQKPAPRLAGNAGAPLGRAVPPMPRTSVVAPLMRVTGQRPEEHEKQSGIRRVVTGRPPGFQRGPSNDPGHSTLASHDASP